MSTPLANVRYAYDAPNKRWLAPGREPLLAQSTVRDGFVEGWGYPSWEDHFEGTSLNSSVWNIRNNYQEAQSRETMRTGNIVVENSCVRLMSKLETYNGREYTSGYIDTIGKWWRRFGRWEMYAKIPIEHNISRGMWPAFWLRDQTGQGEIDIMESAGTPNEHPSSYPTGQGRFSSSFYRTTGVRTNGSPYQSRIYTNANAGDGKFHKFAFEWTPTRATFLFDDRALWTLNETELEPFMPGFPSGGNMRIDTFIGTNWIGYPTPEGTIWPRSFDIDYIRYWSLQ
ncbi:glycoside hydrolase family 16 protein [Microbacterium lacus]|uniref:glycoside hydrolase family 16 protein n=1 Tax=Microbacterium lacus TaxID=415217 RepID=UPI000C2BB0F1|nr:glycoside hydrolase family 16 protein [Microbacterium lacus]